MKTPMTDLREDLVDAIKTGTEALNEINDKEIREACSVILNKTLSCIIKRIDDELLEEEKQVIICAWQHGELRVPEEMKHINNAQNYYNETFKKD